MQGNVSTCRPSDGCRRGTDPEMGIYAILNCPLGRVVQKNSKKVEGKIEKSRVTLVS